MMKTRAKKSNETVLKNTRRTIEYKDELGRNTYYLNERTGVWYEKEWVRLADGRDKESHVWGSNGYWRKHFYDIHTGLLMEEIDSHGSKNLLDKRRAWNQKDNEISQEILNKRKSSEERIINKSTELF